MPTGSAVIAVQHQQQRSTSDAGTAYLHHTGRARSSQKVWSDRRDSASVSHQAPPQQRSALLVLAHALEAPLCTCMSVRDATSHRVPSGPILHVREITMITGPGRRSLKSYLIWHLKCTCVARCGLTSTDSALARGAS